MRNKTQHLSFGVWVILLSIDFSDSFLKIFILIVYVCVCMCIQMPECCISLELELLPHVTCTTWVLGTELREPLQDQDRNNNKNKVVLSPKDI